MRPDLIGPATKLRSLRMLGGQLVSTDAGSFWAIFDREFLEAVGTEARVPVLTCRTSDAERYVKAKGTTVTVGTDVYHVQRHERDGTGMTLVYLV